MKLSDIAKQVLNEDNGNLPVNQPATAEQPATAAKVYDVKQDYQNFKTVLEKQVESTKKGLISTLGQNLLNKKVTFRASKGAIGQIEKDYTIVVTGIDVTQMKDEYYIVLKDKEQKDYYVNTEFKMKVVEAGANTGSEESESPQASVLQPPENHAYTKQAGAIKYPQNMGLQSNKPPSP